MRCAPSKYSEQQRLCGGLDRSHSSDRLRAECSARLAVITHPRDHLKTLDDDGLSQRQLRLLPSHRDVDDLPTVRALHIQLDDPLQPTGRLVLPLRTGLPINLRLRLPRDLRRVPRRVKHEPHDDLPIGNLLPPLNIALPPALSSVAGHSEDVS